MTGPLAAELKLNDGRLPAITQPAPTDVSIGAGFILSMVALFAVGVLSGWQYFAVSPRYAPGP